MRVDGGIKKRTGTLEKMREPNARFRASLVYRSPRASWADDVE